MIVQTKGDIVRQALEEVAIASNATLTDVEPQSMEQGVIMLEMMMAEWYQDGDGIDTGYIFSDDANPPIDGDDHGMRTSAVAAVINNLAIRFCSSYGIEARAKTVTTARYGKELLVKKTAMLRAKNAKCASGYPNRMPIGSGNRLATYNGWNYFHRKGPCDNGSD